MIDPDVLNIIFKQTGPAKKWTRFLSNDPQYVRPVVTKNNVRDKYMFRYFIKSVNDVDNIVEIDKFQYEIFKSNPRFATAKILWKIVGNKETTELPSGAKNFGVSDLNLGAVVEADLTFKGIKRYITDYTEFWVSDT